MNSVNEITKGEYQTVLRNDFASFIERAFYELNPQTLLKMAPYIELMADRLEQCRQGRIRRLVINIPPRYLKSHCASVAFVAWLLGHKPSTSVICASYGQDLADKLAIDTRNIMRAAWYQELFVARLDPDRQPLDDFKTIQSGGRMATSVNGVLTGRGADFIILDDPLKPDDAMSQTLREKVNNWYDNSLLSRLNDKTNGCIIVIMQRLHQDDLVGHILEQNDWTVLSLPAIAEEDECRGYRRFGKGLRFRRQEGEVLHPERESLVQLRRMQKQVGSYIFSSQYQQRPIPEGGAIVKSDWLQYYDELPPADDIRYRFQSWDTASKVNELNDYSVCTSWMIDKKERYFLVDVFRKRLEYPDLVKEVKRLYQEFRPDKLLIEDKSSGSALIQDLKREGVIGIEPCQPKPGEDKVMRLATRSNLIEAGRVYLPEEASWLEDYRTELIGFPGSKYDDQVDSTSQALGYIKDKYNPTIAQWIKLGEGWEEYLRRKELGLCY